MARNVLCQNPERLFLFEKGRSMMPIDSDRRRRDRSRGRYGDLDWFAEDPWGEPDLAALEDNSEDERYPGLWEPTDDDEAWSSDHATDPSDEEPHDGWGPVRRRRKRPSHGP